MRARRSPGGCRRGMLGTLVAAVCGLLWAMPAAGQSLQPRVGVEMVPSLSSFFDNLHNTRGEWCCTSADTRITKIRNHDGVLEAWIGDQYPDVADGHSPAGWYPVPAWAEVVMTPNIVNKPVVAFYDGHVHCFLGVTGF